MTHPNDTLNGKLLAWERPEDKPLRHKFGYWHMVEERMVRAQLEAEGVTSGTPGFWMTLANRILENHKDDPKPWHDRLGLAYGGAIRQQAAFEREALATLTAEEWRFLIEHFEGANDPLAQAILTKAKMQIGH